MGSSLIGADILSFLSTLSLEKVFVFGGSGAISDNVISSIYSKNPVNQLYGLNFGPYLDGQDPNLGAKVSESQIRSRMEIIAPYTKWIRTYGCTGGLENSGAIAHELGLKAAVGAWIGKDKEANRLEISSLINEIKSGHADMAIVGNETLLRGDISEAELISLIKEVKDASKAAGVNIPVSTVETYGELLNRPNLMNACDVVLANYHPYWEGLHINSAVSSFESMYAKLKRASGVKTVIFSEIGWPDDGNAKGSAVPTAENAKKFFNDFIFWAQNNNIPYFYFEAFDESWKANYEGAAGSHWGIWNSKGDMKFDITSILNQPAIEFTYVPPIGSFDNLKGRTANINPDDYKIAVYIKVSGSWWIKPYADTTLAKILPDGTWSCDITTGGIDSTATSVAAFLIPKNYSPPLLLGGASLPEALNQNSTAKVITDR